jgi:hypothetical protein
LKSALLAAASMGAAADATTASAASAQGGSAVAGSTVNMLVATYMAAWNEREPTLRRELVAKTWAEDGTYIDAHRRGAGHDAIDAMIRTAQEQFPGYRLGLVSGIETHNGYARFRWAAGGTPEAPLYLAGTDFIVIADDGRLKSVTGFVDAAPAPVERS